MKPRDIGMLLLLATLWGASFWFIKVASPILGPTVLIDLRVLMAGLALSAYAGLLKQRPNLLHKWKEYLILGAMNAAIPFCLIAAAEIRLDASLAAVLNSTTPLFTALIARIWTQERLTVKKMLGLSSGVFGVVILVGWDPTSGAGRLVSIGLSLGAAFLYGLGGVYSAKRFVGEKPLNLAIGQQLAAGLLLLPVAVFFSRINRQAPL